MEQIPEPPEGVWSKAGPPDPNAKARLPGFTFLVWLAAIASAACVHGLRTAAGQARAADLPRAGTALDALAVLGAVVLASAALAYVSRRWFSV